MVDLTRKIAAEKENVEKALDNLKDAMGRKERSTVELAAIATFLLNIYNGIENILKQVLKSRGNEIPKSETSHKDLLDISVSNGIIPEKLSDQLYEYLTFRHFFVHAYGFMLEEIHLEDLANNIPDVWLQFLLAIQSNTSDNTA
ncbi:MAG: HepT-like ribonuclease domain-containing protein [Planctomycetota bacterium]